MAILRDAKCAMQHKFRADSHAQHNNLFLTFASKINNVWINREKY